jgi:Protein of unknown function (DUF4232)
MNMRITTLRHYAVAAVACAMALLLSAVAAYAATQPRTSARAEASPCSANHTQIWLGLGGGGAFAGGVEYPLEFSNVGHRTCTLNGVPRVIPYEGATQVGPAATHGKAAHKAVTLAPGASAHTFLTISDWGAICTSPVSADELEVYAPGQRAAKPIDFSLQVCAHRAVLLVGPVVPGVGIPG